MAYTPRGELSGIRSMMRHLDLLYFRSGLTDTRPFREAATVNKGSIISKTTTELGYTAMC